MKKYLILIVGLFIFNLPMVNAAYYYVLDNGNYNLCATNTTTCSEVSKDASGLTVDNSNKRINYNNEFYEFDSSYQESYYKTTYGQTRMYFYMSNDDFILCKRKQNCQTYSRKKLEDNGAIIANKSQVALSNEEIYYYNSTYESSSAGGSNNGTNNASNDDVGYCTKLKAPLEFIGNIVLIFKIFIPIILIFLGAMDLFKAVTAGKDDELKKSLRIFALRCVAGIAIFFLPTIISFVFSLVSSWASLKGDFNQCQKYVLNVRNSD